MSEINRPELFLPAYWDQHHNQDSCPTKGTVLQEIGGARVIIELERSSQEIIQMRARLSAELEKYSLTRGGTELSLARFEKGSFDPRQLPHGTLISMISEHLYLNPMEERFSTAKEYGFIVDTAGITEHGQQVVLNVAGGILYGGNPDVIEIGQVLHRRNQVREGQVDRFSRTLAVDVISVGSGIKQPGIQSRLSSLIPAWNSGTLPA